MPTDMELEILEPVVASVAVFVMHRFVVEQRPAEVLGHDVTVLQYVTPVAIGICNPKLHVALTLANVTAAFPVRILRTAPVTPPRTHVAHSAATAAEACREVARRNEDRTASFANALLSAPSDT